MSVIEAHAITKVFKEGREPIHVLRGVSLSVGRGEIVSLEGPSGSGKATLLLAARAAIGRGASPRMAHPGQRLSFRYAPR